jgi:hypothetical protein
MCTLLFMLKTDRGIPGISKDDSKIDNTNIFR